MSRALLTVTLLALIYALVLGSFAVWDLIIAVGLATVLVALGRRYMFGGPALAWSQTLRRSIRFIPFVVAVAREVVTGAAAVTLVALRLRPLRRAGIIAIPIEDRTKTGVAVSALVMTLAPGSVLIDIDWQRHVMLFHVLNAGDEDAIRDNYRRFYQRYQRPVFP